MQEDKVVHRWHGLVMPVTALFRQCGLHRQEVLYLEFVECRLHFHFALIRDTHRKPHQLHTYNLFRQMNTVG